MRDHAARSTQPAPKPSSADPVITGSTAPGKTKRHKSAATTPPLTIEPAMTPVFPGREARRASGRTSSGVAWASVVELVMACHFRSGRM
jgi:hypothetical protein